MARVKVRHLGNGQYHVRVVRSRPRERLGGKGVRCDLTEIAAVVLEGLPQLAPTPATPEEAARNVRVYNTEQ